MDSPTTAHFGVTVATDAADCRTASRVTDADDSRLDNSATAHSKAPLVTVVACASIAIDWDTASRVTNIDNSHMDTRPDFDNDIARLISGLNKLSNNATAADAEKRRS